MAQAGGPVGRANLYMQAAMLAHETIWGLHERLAAADLSDTHTRERVRRSAEVTTNEIPRALAEVLRLQERWSEQDLLDPPAAAVTLRSLATELDRIGPEVRRLRAEQNEIAREFRDLLGRE